MKIKNINLICTKCKASIWDKNDVAALDNEIVHQSCKNEWIKFQKYPKPLLESLDSNVSFVNQTFENQSTYSIMTDLGFQREETFGMDEELRFGQTDDFVTIFSHDNDDSYQPVEENREQPRIFFQRFEFIYPYDFTNQIALLDFTRAGVYSFS